VNSPRADAVERGAEESPLGDELLHGRAWLFGDDISTDQIAPGRLFHLRTDLPELAKHVLEDARPEFAAGMRPGDFVVGGRNFGLGSSREHAPRIIKIAGAGAVLAQSFARIFFRNAINVGLPIVECPGTGQVPAGAAGELDLAAGVFRAGEVELRGAPYPEAMRRLIDAGGLMPYVAAKLAKSGRRG
jgi:3-isopropylmalate/(R)-2-methylmalate dehydratase small subunit